MLDEQRLPFGYDPDSAYVDWAGAGRVHDWRNYVGRRTRALWESLTPKQRTAIVLDADDLAGREEWD